MPTYKEPKVFLLGEPKLDRDQVAEYLTEIGADAQAWLQRKRDVGDLELLSEIMGRVCYNSFEVGLNPNVTQIRQSSQAYIANLIDKHHFAIFDHVMINFIFANVSRVLTHELVRHRPGVGIAQQSLVYVRLIDIPFRVPPFVRDDPNKARRELILARSEELLKEMESMQALIAEQYDIEHASFSDKMVITSGARRWLPDGLLTQIGWSCDVSELRYVIKIRTEPTNDEEIKLLFEQVRDICIERWPWLFADLA